MVQKLLQHQQDAPPSITAIRPDVPERLATILARLMEKDPHDRYQRPAVLVADLVACAEENGIELSSAGRGMPAAVAVPQPAKSVLPWLAPVLGLLAIVAALWLKAAADRRPAAAPASPAAKGAD